MKQLECEYCAHQRDADAESWVLTTDLWLAAAYPLHDVPGAVVCMLRRHVEDLPSMTAAEAHAMGTFAATVADAIARVVRPEKTYMLMFLEQKPHLHFVLLPRDAGVDAAGRGPQYVIDRPQFADADEARRMTERLRADLSGTGLSGSARTSARPDTEEI
jgi:diadenosine tetraphosphate (Ap4A) HIT family hydrolase